ncbi:MAG: t-SNARE [Olpidium bornovanus]|uniref:t-SNARE n=1 Tax=Olpidium bornovanus TaxID=278681 RepID=A0A8H7ZRG1_9FUNG|nr:MAG: t-SNARE [Olpidium bornovanus]
MAIRTSQHGQLKKKFMDFLLMYNEVEREHSAQVKQQMEAQIRFGRRFFRAAVSGVPRHLLNPIHEEADAGQLILLDNPGFTDEDVQDALEQQLDGQMLTQQASAGLWVGAARRTPLMANQGGRYTGASAALQEVQARQNDMMKIEQTIIQLTQLFTEMSTLVEAQGQTIATIEQHVENTEQYTEQAAEEITQAVVTAKRVRSNKWKLLVLCILMFVIAGVLLYLFVLKDFINGLLGGNNAAKATATPAAVRTRAVVQPLATSRG